MHSSSGWAVTTRARSPERKGLVRGRNKITPIIANNVTHNSIILDVKFFDLCSTITVKNEIEISTFLTFLISNFSAKTNASASVIVLLQM